MRKPKYLSPTSVSLFYSDRTEYYLKYLAVNRAPRMQQTKPMSIGSAFDAYVKSYLTNSLFGVTAGFDFEEIFEQQVEEHNRDWAKPNGQYVFNAYKQSGALADLLLELNQAAEEPNFEMKVEHNISHVTKKTVVPMLGYPDIHFLSKERVPVIYDWKVNGYCGKSGISPAKGYIKCRDAWDGALLKNTRSHNKSHKDAHLLMEHGIQYNGAHPLNEVDKKWADQTISYGWMLGQEIGSDFLVGIDQIVKYKDGGAYPLLRVATHRCKVPADYQFFFFGQVCNVWETIQHGHIFDEMSRKESDARCEILDNHYKEFGNPDDPQEKWFNGMAREW